MTPGPSGSTTTITSKGQVTIPKAIRELLHLRTGDQLDFVVEDDKVFIEPAASDIRRLRGLLHRPGRKAVSVEEMDEGIGEYLSRKLARSPSRD